MTRVKLEVQQYTMSGMLKKNLCSLIFVFLFLFVFFFVFCSQQNVNILVGYVVYVARARALF